MTLMLVELVATPLTFSGGPSGAVCNIVKGRIKYSP